jgi:hypothetical protein
MNGVIEHEDIQAIPINGDSGGTRMHNAVSRDVNIDRFFNPYANLSRPVNEVVSDVDVF